MVGKLQDVVSAAVVVNAAEKYNANSNRSGANQQSASSFEAPAATVENSQNRLVIDATNIQTDADSAKKQNDDVNVQLKQPVDEKTVANITEELNKVMRNANANLHFNYHQEAGMFSVALVDKDTNEVIKELPPEEMVKNIVKGRIWMDAFIGTFVDESA